MKESKLEIKSKRSIFKKFDNFLFKLTAYVIDGIPFYNDKSMDTAGIYSNLEDVKLYKEDSKLL